MTGEGELLVWVPDPVAVVGAVGVARLNEGRLGEPHLLREGEHRLVADPVRVVDDGKPVAGQGPLGEDVQPGDSVRHPHMIPIREGSDAARTVFRGTETNEGERYG